MKRKGARHVGWVVDGLLRKLEQRTVKKANAVMAAWAAAAGEEEKKHARPVSLKNGRLMVITENSSWLYKLTLEKKGILERFNANYTGRKKALDIRFRVGSIDVE